MTVVDAPETVECASLVCAEGALSISVVSVPSFIELVPSLAEDVPSAVRGGGDDNRKTIRTMSDPF